MCKYMCKYVCTQRERAHACPHRACPHRVLCALSAPGAYAATSDESPDAHFHKIYVSPCTSLLLLFLLPLAPISPTPLQSLWSFLHPCTKRFLCKLGHLSIIVWGPNGGKIPCHRSRGLWMAASLRTIGGGAEKYSWEDYLTFQFRGHKAQLINELSDGRW